jgi:hypothetical protein
VVSNYFRFVLNRHPLFGLICHHRLHPFTTKKRVIVFLCSLSFAFVLSVGMLEKMYFREVSPPAPLSSFLIINCCVSSCTVLSHYNSLFCTQKFVCADGCDKANVTDEHGNQRMQCVGGSNDGMDYGK